MSIADIGDQMTDFVNFNSIKINYLGYGNNLLMYLNQTKC